MKEKTKIFKVDVDKSDDLAQKYDVMGFSKSFGSGLVTGCKQNEVQVEFPNGTTRKFNMEALCCNKLMQVLEQ